MTLNGATTTAPSQVQGSPTATATTPQLAPQSAAVTRATDSPGALTVKPATESLSLAGPGHLESLSPITVDDARGSLVGWRTTVSLQTVSGLGAAQLASTRLCVSPHPTTLVAGNPADIVRSSPRACASPVDPIAVFFAAPGGGDGEYSDTASVNLVVPSGAPAGGTVSLAVSVS